MKQQNTCILSSKYILFSSRRHCKMTHKLNHNTSMEVLNIYFEDETFTSWIDENNDHIHSKSLNNEPAWQSWEKGMWTQKSINLHAHLCSLMRAIVVCIRNAMTLGYTKCRVKTAEIGRLTSLIQHVFSKLVPYAAWDTINTTVYCTIKQHENLTTLPKHQVLICDIHVLVNEKSTVMILVQIIRM